jgi:hypothetical protein
MILPRDTELDILAARMEWDHQQKMKEAREQWEAEQRQLAWERGKPERLAMLKVSQILAEIQEDRRNREKLVHCAPASAARCQPDQVCAPSPRR